MMPDLNPETDLEISRLLKAPRALVWRCWTEPDLLMQWFCPKPFEVPEARMDLKPGGQFFTRMRGPDGTEFDNDGIYLAVEPENLLVFTDTLDADWRPTREPFMTGLVQLSDETGGTRYIARAYHADSTTRERHVEMGFYDGWNMAADQLDTLALSLAERKAS